MAKTTFSTLDELVAASGSVIGPGPWLAVDQTRIDAFAAITDDRQWLHTDPARARAESPFGGPVAHGMLTLSLVPGMAMALVEVAGAKLVVNYGFERVRFPAPVMVGSKLRLALTIEEVTETAGGVQVCFAVVLENDRQEKPACVAQLLFRYYF